MLLALDTATDNASIALHDGAQVWAEISWRSRRRHTVELAPQVDALLRLAGAAPGDLTALAVSIGPGSYAGTRVGLSFAKGLVAALSLPLLGIPSLDILAYAHPHPTLPLVALIAAGRGRYNWALYAPAAALPQRQSAWGLDALPALLARCTPPLRFVGDLDAAAAAQIQAWDAAATLIPPGLGLRRAGVLAELAWQRRRRGERDDPILLEPIYLTT